ncbi:MAG: hemolysin family protein [Polyangiaceae bacterium]
MPAAFASIFAAGSAAVAALSDARRRALVQALSPRRSRSLRRYVEYGDLVEARWMVARVSCIVASALLVHQSVLGLQPMSRVLFSLVMSVTAFTFPAEMAKAIATHNPDRSAATLIGMLWPFEMLAAPFAAPACWLGRLTRHGLPDIPARSEDVLEEEVSLIVKDGQRSGSIAPDEAQMLTNVLDFGELTAKDVMVPRIHVSAISLQTPVDDLLKLVVADEHSRYPVYQERIDNVVGILHVKDLLPYVLNPEALRSLDLQSILHRPVLFVADNQSAGSVLYEMRQKQQHLAVVIDEFGGVSGVLSLEDLLERIVGDIRDEHDEEEPPIVNLGAGRLMVDASVSMTDLGRYLGTDLPEDDAYTSLGGLLVAQLGRVPQVGTKLREFGLEFVVRDADDRHVARVEILRGPPSSTSLGPVSRRIDSDPN